MRAGQPHRALGGLLGQGHPAARQQHHRLLGVAERVDDRDVLRRGECRSGAGQESMPRTESAAASAIATSGRGEWTRVPGDRFPLQDADRQPGDLVRRPPGR